MAHLAHPAPCISGNCELSEPAQRNAASQHANWMKQVNNFADFIALALQRRAQRRALMRLSTEALSDIGLTRADVEEEYRKSFWRP